MSMLVAGEGVAVVEQRLALASGWCAMVIGAVVVGYCRECPRELTWEQQGTSKKFKGNIVVTVMLLLSLLLWLLLNQPQLTSAPVNWWSRSIQTFSKILLTFKNKSLLIQGHHGLVQTKNMRFKLGQHSNQWSILSTLLSKILSVQSKDLAVNWVQISDIKKLMRSNTFKIADANFYSTNINEETICLFGNIS